MKVGVSSYSFSKYLQQTGCNYLKLCDLAKEMGFDYFCTTLSISPLKDAQKINAIGQSVGEQYGVAWLPSDFKKQERYKRSIALSREYGLYRQNFCGCVYSKNITDKKTEINSEE